MCCPVRNFNTCLTCASVICGLVQNVLELELEKEEPEFFVFTGSSPEPRRRQLRVSHRYHTGIVGVAYEYVTGIIVVC